MELFADKEERLDQFLARVLPEHSRSRLAEWIKEGKVRVEGAPRPPRHKLKEGDRVVLEAPTARKAHDLTPVRIPLEVVFEDDDVVVVSKPRGLATHPAVSLSEPSLVNALLARAGGLSKGSAAYRPGIVHRLDKETTGLLMVAKTDFAHAHLARQVEKKQADRRYFAVVAGHLAQERFDVDAPIGRDPRFRLKMAVVPDGKPALTHVTRVAEIGENSLVAVRLTTGRTHQIRVHLLAIGHPVLGDATYAPKEHRDHPLQLHAAYLAFRHPRTGEVVECYCPPPEDFLGRDEASKEAFEAESPLAQTVTE